MTGLAFTTKSAVVVVCRDGNLNGHLMMRCMSGMLGGNCRSGRRTVLGGLLSPRAGRAEVHVMGVDELAVMW